MVGYKDLNESEDRFRGKEGGKSGDGTREECVCVQINVDVFKKGVKGRVGSSGLFSLAHLPSEAATNRKV